MVTTTEPPAIVDAPPPAWKSDYDGPVDIAPALERANAILATHVANVEGFCQACLASTAGHISVATPHPCTVRHWAERTFIIAGTEARNP